ncbi:DEAD/DEAH box helicase [Aliarcobacter butzleri]|nr:DEAD/DEAH box helicase [Aliarcobacter butzleri]
MLHEILLNSVSEQRNSAIISTNKSILLKELKGYETVIDDSINNTIAILELAFYDLIKNPENCKESIIKISADLFKLYKNLPKNELNIKSLQLLLKQSCFGIIAELGISASKELKDYNKIEQLENNENWKIRTTATVFDIWIRLIRKKGWEDRDIILEDISTLRILQTDYESNYLSNNNSKANAYELIVLYHLAAAAEKLATFITEGHINGNFQIQTLLDAHFDRALAVFQKAPMIDLEPLTNLLIFTAEKLVNNSIWTITRSTNTQIMDFVKELVSSGRGNKALFDLLPPQRQVLAEQGLLGSSRRAVVVSLPTSSGKTMIAQFRILQALNQFENGWVAYLVPTRALVNQITRRLRKDFHPLGISVEQISPALEIDSFEMDILQENQQEMQFKVLVTTPEKLDLMLRQGWEKKIDRPLSLVIVDEAHNIQDKSRGLKLELLLANINKECEYAQFLLLTPFIKNAKEIATWLGGQNSQDISLSLDWQPNDRTIGITYPTQTNLTCQSRCNFNINFKSVHTSKPTIAIKEEIPLISNSNVFTFNQISSSNSNIASVVVNKLKERDSVIVIHGTVPWVWSLADKIKMQSTRLEPSEKILYVQKFLAYEFGQNFKLIDLLNHKIGVHHAGLSDEVRTLMEWLFEEKEINVLVATTTIAQGMNFPIGAVVMASNKYFSTDQAEEMPLEDFWNIAGRAGRADQDNIGIVTLTAKSQNEINNLTEYVYKQVEDLNSSLIQMVKDAIQRFDIEDLGKIVYQDPRWSSFLQYLTHTYKEMNENQEFSTEIEQVLRGTFGFSKLRSINRTWSNKFIRGIEKYTAYMLKPNQPIKLVDSTGFSLQSVNQLLQQSREHEINRNSWNRETLFGNDSAELQKMIGVLIKIPELRENYEAILNRTNTNNGNTISDIVKDWVNGIDLSTIAIRYFQRNNDTLDDALTRCCQNLYGNITQTTSWGLSALLSSTVGEIDEEEFKELSNLPAQVYYGVNNKNAMLLRLLGVPRIASNELSKVISNISSHSVVSMRHNLRSQGDDNWKLAMGEEKGQVYYKIWSILEGI